RNSRVTRAGRLGTVDVEGYHNRFLSASHHNGFIGLIRPGIDLLIENVRRHIDKIAGPSLIAKLKFFAPPHPRPPPHHVQNGFQFPMVMGACLCIRLNDHVPAHNRLAPVRAWVIAAALIIPGVCGVFASRSPARTILMPCSFQSITPPLPPRILKTLLFCTLVERMLEVQVAVTPFAVALTIKVVYITSNLLVVCLPSKDLQVTRTRRTP